MPCPFRTICPHHPCRVCNAAGLERARLLAGEQLPCMLLVLLDKAFTLVVLSLRVCSTYVTNSFPTQKKKKKVCWPDASRKFAFNVKTGMVLSDSYALLVGPSADTVRNQSTAAVCSFFAATFSEATCSYSQHVLNHMVPHCSARLASAPSRSSRRPTSAVCCLLLLHDVFTLPTLRRRLYSMYSLQRPLLQCLANHSFHS